MPTGTLERQESSANLLGDHSVDKSNAEAVEHISPDKSVTSTSDAEHPHLPDSDLANDAISAAPLAETAPTTHDDAAKGSEEDISSNESANSGGNVGNKKQGARNNAIRWLGGKIKNSAIGRGVSALGSGIMTGLNRMGGAIVRKKDGIKRGYVSKKASIKRSYVRGKRAMGLSIDRGIKNFGEGVISIKKKMGIGLSKEEIDQKELQGLNPEYEQRFGTKTGLKKGIMGTAGVLGAAGLGTGIGFKAAGQLDNLSDSAKLNIGGAGGVLGGALGIGLGIKGIMSGSNRLDLARKHGDKAGKAIAKEDIASNSVGLTKGAISTASAGVQFAGAAGRIGVDMAKGVASGLGAATGALTIAEGLFKGGVDAMHLHKTRTFKPLSSKGIDWRSHIVKKKSMRVGVNVLKVIGGALGVAGSVLSGGALALGLAAASAGIGIGMALTKMGKGMLQRGKMKATRKDEEAKALKADPDKKFDKTISKDNITKANELRKTTKTGSIAFEMIEAVKKSSADKLDEMRKLHIASQKGPSIKDKMLSFFKSFGKGGDNNENKQNMIKAEEAQAKAANALMNFGSDFESYDAHELLTAIGISKDEATSASGQELIEKKISVTNSL
jgi:hypothetical protein